MFFANLNSKLFCTTYSWKICKCCLGSLLNLTKGRQGLCEQCSYLRSIPLGSPRRTFPQVETKVQPQDDMFDSTLIPVGKTYALFVHWRIWLGSCGVPGGRNIKFAHPLAFEPVYLFGELSQTHTLNVNNVYIWLVITGYWNEEIRSVNGTYHIHQIVGVVSSTLTQPGPLIYCTTCSSCPWRRNLSENEHRH